MQAGKRKAFRDLSRKARSGKEYFLPVTSHAGHPMPAHAGHPVPAYAGEEGLSSMHDGQDKQSHGDRQQDGSKHFEWCDRGGLQGRFSSTIFFIHPVVSVFQPTGF